MGNPVFLIGCHRSGTTLLRYILDAHPNIACPPESKIFKGIAAFLEEPQVIQGIGSLGVDRRQLLDSMRKLADGLLNDHARRKRKPRWVEKTPNNVQHLDLIDQIYAGEAQYIVIVRHPLDVIASLAVYFSESSKHEDVDIARNHIRYGGGMCGWAKYWQEANLRMSLFAAQCGDRCVIIRYEDLVAKPEKEIRRVFTFLGEQTPKDILRKAFRKEYDGGLQDGFILDTKKVHSRSVGKWRYWPKEYVRELWSIVKDPAQSWGYSISRR